MPNPGDDADKEISKDVIVIIFMVLDGYDFRQDVAVDAVRHFRSAIHGFASFEVAGEFGLPSEFDRSFALTVQNVDGAFATWARI